MVAPAEGTAMVRLGSRTVAAKQVARGLLLAMMLPTSAAFAGSVERIDGARLEALMAAGIEVVDIRRSEEWRETGIVPGSRLITAFDGEGRLVEGFIERVRSAIADGRPFALICRSGNRSATAAGLLAAVTGEVTIYDVDGGIRAWAAAGRPLSPCAAC